MKRKIYVTQKDRDRLLKLYQGTIGFREKDQKTIKALIEELKRATVLNTDEIPPNVITMNTTVKIKDLIKGDTYIYTIVYPEEANFEEKKISILAPIGTALIGYKEGDIVEWEVPAGKRKLKVEKIIYQPEAASKVAV